MTISLPDQAMHWDDGDETPRVHAAPADPWASLRRHTPARISLGRAGTSLPTAEVLRFAAAHAAARDAVHLPLDTQALLADLNAQALHAECVTSRAATRAEYLARPDLGRQLSPASRATLHDERPSSLCIVIGDGLSAVAAQRHAVPVVVALQAALRLQGEQMRVVVATQARVALGDEIGEAMGAALVVMLIGERPGLTALDSLGAYLTMAPRRGRTDAERNCISNIRPAGLVPAQAAEKLAWLVGAARRLGASGVTLKDEQPVAPLLAT
jgi:ethanolamine ammonia-lyase small subunit